jgi:hypothetical protein
MARGGDALPERIAGPRGPAGAGRALAHPSGNEAGRNEREAAR